MRNIYTLYHLKGFIGSFRYTIGDLTSSLSSSYKYCTFRILPLDFPNCEKQFPILIFLFTVNLHLGINVFITVVKRHGVTLSLFYSSEVTIYSGICLGPLEPGGITDSFPVRLWGLQKRALNIPQIPTHNSL